MTTADTDRPGRSRRAADRLREGILDGSHRVGTRLSEPELCAVLDVSRNTLRESFRMLAEERLVVHEFNRGVFVRIPTEGDVREVYDARRLVECAALQNLDRSAGGLDALEEVLRRADRSAEAGDWIGVGAADVDFHRALTALGSVRIEALMRSVWHEVRLAFHVVGRPEEFHGAYLQRNHHLLATVRGRGGAAAAEELRGYLDEAEGRVLRAYRVPS